MSKTLLKLFPEPGERALEGTYLGEDLPPATQPPGRPFVYANFVSSLDGRIGIARPHRETHAVPEAIANPRDWRLYQELGARADILITSARYYRQFARGEAQDTLPVGAGEAFADLRAWRIGQGLEPQPDVAIVSASLDIPAEAIAAYRERRLHLFTGPDADPARVAALEALGVSVHFAGEGRSVSGDAMVRRLGELGYRSAYAIAGSSVFYTLVHDGALDRLYLTLAHRLLGGEDFDTLTWGSELVPPQSLVLRSLYYDGHAPEGCGQLLAAYDCVPRE